MLVLGRVELGRGDGRDADLHDQEPGHLEVPRPLRDVRREGVAVGHFDLGEVREHEVAALRVRVRQPELGEDLAEPRDLAFHLADGAVPEALAIRLLEADGRGLLEGRDAGVADPGVGGGDVLDQVRLADQEADAPAGGIEVLAGGADGEGEFGDFRGECADPGEWDVVQAVVYFVGEDDGVVF